MSDRPSILVVDDTPESLRLLTDILKDEGYRVRPALGPELALRSAASQPPDLMLLDIRMPNLDGFEVCRRLKADPTTSDVPVIFVSAMSETDEKVKGFALGAVDFVTKPYQREELLARVHTHLELRRLRNNLEALVEERTSALSASLHGFVVAISTAMDIRDPYTAGHQRRVSDLAVAICRELALPAQEVEGIRLSSLIHDLGKIRTPAEILTRPGRLNVDEFNLIKRHPNDGYEILKSIEFPWPIAQMVRQHHERQDGSGYPEGLAGGDILFGARILAVADVVEAMSSHRPYRPGLGVAVALDEIRAKQGTHYDADIVAATLALFDKRSYTMPT
jgi:putative nucleotidyltransferase with HDIG domain